MEKKIEKKKITAEGKCAKKGYCWEVIPCEMCPHYKRFTKKKKKIKK
jgi:hypothetical protein